LLNVNVPNLPEEQLKGFKLTRQGYSGFSLASIGVKEVSTSGSTRKYRICDKMNYCDADPTVDSLAVRQGFITVTPLPIIPLHGYATVIADLQSWPLFQSRAN